MEEKISLPKMIVEFEGRKIVFDNIELEKSVYDKVFKNGFSKKLCEKYILNGLKLEKEYPNWRWWYIQTPYGQIDIEENVPEEFKNWEI